MSVRRIAIGVAVIVTVGLALVLWSRHGTSVFLASLGGVIC